MKQLLTLAFLIHFISTTQAQGKYPSILWEISKPGNTKPSYLFGTYHISSKGVFKLGDSIFYALKNVDIVAKELNANTWQADQAGMSNMEMSYNSYNSLLRNSSITENTFKKTNTVEKIPAFLGLTPSFINYFLYRNNASNEGFEEEMYLDRFISSTGYKYGKEIKGLENYLESNVLSIEGRKDALDIEKREIKKIPGGISYREMNDKIYDGYLNNNLNAMDSFLFYQYESEAIFKKFIVQRNYNQADSLDYYIKTGKAVFGAVGCAHLPGKEGVIEILKSKGYTLRPVKLEYKNNEQLEAVKKIVVPMELTPQAIDDVIQVMAPGKFHLYNETDILTTYGYVDMKNGAYYLIARLLNNAHYFNYNQTQLAKAIDSLLYTSIKGNILKKENNTYKGFPSIDVVAQVKNKDIERYKIIITPYEIIKFQVGGKNTYAQVSFVDSFFNSIQIASTSVLPKNFSFAFKNDLPFHKWSSGGYGYLQMKQRFTNYNEKNNQLNTCVKILLPTATANNDTTITHLLKESILKSDMYNEDLIEDNSVLNLFSSDIQKLETIKGKHLAYKLVNDYPYIYLLSSLYDKELDKSFIDAFQLQPNNSTEQAYNFTDEERGFSVTLPYKIEINKRWKLQVERERKKFDDEKDPNAQRNLFYYPSMYGNNSVSNNLLFEDKLHMESVYLTYNQFDSLSYYPSATSFWKNIVDKFLPISRATSSNYYEEVRPVVTNDIEVSTITTTFNANNRIRKGKIISVIYDTSNNYLQKLNLVYFDSSTLLSTVYHYYLCNNKFYQLNYIQNKTGLSSFQKQIVSSFKPNEINSSIQIYQSKFLTIINDYFKATKIKQPAILSRLNNIHLGVKNLKQVDSLFKILPVKSAEIGVLKIKLMDMVKGGIYDADEWKIISNWFKEIYSNSQNLTTVKNYALSSIIERNASVDAAWLIKNFINTGNAFQKRFSRQLSSYLLNLYPKKEYLPLVKFTIKDEDDLRYLPLLDSGYFSITEKQVAFKTFKKNIEAEALTLQIAQEKKLFQFNEKELDENATNSRGYSNFNDLLNGFKYFYTATSTDTFFVDGYRKIISSNVDEDLITLLNIFLKHHTSLTPEMLNLVKQLSVNQKNIYEINKAFYKNKRYVLLPDSLKNKILIAKNMLLLDRGRYMKFSNITFLGAQKYPYNKSDSLYFFTYTRDKELNANLAYVILGKQEDFLSTRPEVVFTNEQISKAETFEKLSAKLIRRAYTVTNFKAGANFYRVSNGNKLLESED